MSRPIGDGDPSQSQVPSVPPGQNKDSSNPGDDESGANGGDDNPGNNKGNSGDNNSDNSNNSRGIRGGSSPSPPPSRLSNDSNGGSSSPSPPPLGLVLPRPRLLKRRVCISCAKRLHLGSSRTINRKNGTTDTVMTGRACTKVGSSSCEDCSSLGRSGCEFVPGIFESRVTEVLFAYDTWDNTPDNPMARKRQLYADLMAKQKRFTTDISAFCQETEAPKSLPPAVHRAATRANRELADTRESQARLARALEFYVTNRIGSDDFLDMPMRLDL
jgi:hypothetical protein